MANEDPDLSRRTYVKLTGLASAGMAGLAGCSGGGGSGDTGGGSTESGGSGDDGGSGDGGGSSDGGDGGSGGSMGTLEVLHGWTGGDGARAAEALESAFTDAHPDVTAEFNPIGGGGNENLDAVVANRLQSGDPPSSFANWPGKNLQRYEGALGSVDDVWSDAGFEDTMVQEAVDLHQQGGSFRAVPLGSHRLNCLFYNVSVVEEAGVDPESLDSVSAFADALETVSSETDKIPFTHGMSGTWTTTQLWGAMMLGQEGFDAYMDFINGEGSEEAVRATFESTATVLENYISEDASSIGLTESNQNIINGNAAFIHQGNWAAGAYRNAENFNYDEQWGFVPFPGTEGMYTLHFDSFLYPADNPSPQPRGTDRVQPVQGLHPDADRREHGPVRPVPPGDRTGLRGGRPAAADPPARPRRLAGEDDGAQRRHLLGVHRPVQRRRRDAGLPRRGVQLNGATDRTHVPNFSAAATATPW
jgi:glucose/mannose transport system substrate-binding protein